MANVIDLPELLGATGSGPIDERVSSPTIGNVSIALANTEYSYALPVGSKRFMAKNRENAIVKLSYSVGTSGTTYIEIETGMFYMEENINPSVSITLYFQSSSAAQTLEVISWA